MKASFLRFFVFILFFVSIPALSFAVTAPEPLGTFSIPVNPGDITTIAGDGNHAYSGDGGPATYSSLYAPKYIAVGPGRELYISDTGNNRIRKVNRSGVITTIAGNGFKNYSGNGGPATSASLASPHGLAFSPAGELYFSDNENHCIRKINSVGIISTVAGDGTPSFSGDGGSATLSKLNYPSGIAFDKYGNLFLSDYANSRVRRIGLDGVITTVAGNDTAGYNGDGIDAVAASLYAPLGIAFDGVGNLYIADSQNNRIRMLDTSGKIWTVAETDSPVNVTLDYPGNLYITGPTNSHQVKKIDPEGTISTFAGNGTEGFSGDGGPAVDASFYVPYGLAVDYGHVYISDAGMQPRVRKVIGDVRWNLVLTAGAGGTVSATPDNTATYYRDWDSVSLTATPAEGYEFSGWSGDASGNTNPLDVTMDGNKTITANFAPPQYQLNVASSPSEGGTVVVTPESGPYFSDTPVTLAANANPGYRFTGWTGDTTGIEDISNNSVSFTMGANDRSLTAGFEQVYKLATQANPSGAGSFEITPASPDGKYASGTEVQVKIIPAPGYILTGIGVFGGATPYILGDTINVTMTGDFSITASFAPRDGIQLSIYQNGKNVTCFVAYNVDGVPQTDKPIKLYSKLKTATSWTLKATVYTSNGSVSKTLALSNGNYNLKAEYAPTFSKITRSNIVDCLVAPVVVPPQGVTNPSVTPDSTPNLQWSAFTGATGYYLQTCANSTFAAGMYIQSLSLGNVTNADLPVALPMGIKRYWRVVAQLPTGWSVPSAARYITYKESTSFTGLDANASGNTIQPSVTLVGADGEIPSGKTVTFYYKKGSATTWNTATAVTDVSGFARIATPKTLTNGSYQLYVKFAGDASYAAVTSAKIPFTLPAP